MDKLKFIKFKSFGKVFNLKNIIECDKPYFRGCLRDNRKVIKKFNLTYKKDYFLIYKKNGKTCIAPEGTNNTSIYLSENWIVNNVPKLIKTTDDKTGLYKIPIAPEILVLEDHEKFKDANDNIYNIEVRGERSSDKCWFLLSDVAKAFEMNTLKDNIYNKNTAYNENEHYKNFILPTPASSRFKQNQKERVYLSYFGVLKAIFSSHSDKAKSFTKWTTNTLFTIQMGSETDRKKLVNKIMGVDYKTTKVVLNTNITNIPCVYLFSLGRVKDLRGLMKIDSKFDDDMIVCKYGFSDNLSRRAQDHYLEYTKYGADVKLMFYAEIDSNFNQQAENDIKAVFKMTKSFLDFKGYTEIVCLEEKSIKTIKDHYNNMRDKYGKYFNELMHENEKLKAQITHNEQLHIQEIKTKDSEINGLNGKLALTNDKLTLTNTIITIIKGVSDLPSYIYTAISSMGIVNDKENN